jgi:hypothetical protein
MAMTVIGPERRVTSADLLKPLGPEQQQLVDLIGDAFLGDEDWPIFDYLQGSFERNGLDASKTLESFPRMGSWGYGAIRCAEGGLVVFGHSLSEQDDHLVRPMRSWRDNPVAVSIRPSDDPEKIIQQKDHIRSRLSPMKNIVFYDASTHPLGRLPEVEAE